MTEGGDRRKKQIKVQIGERRKKTRRTEVDRQDLELLYTNTYVPAFDNATDSNDEDENFLSLERQERRKRRRKLGEGVGRKRAENPEIFTTSLAVQDAFAGKKRSMREFAVYFHERKLLVDESGSPISSEVLLKWKFG